jgi:hypothetical protein
MTSFTRNQGRTRIHVFRVRPDARRRRGRLDSSRIGPTLRRPELWARRLRIHRCPPIGRCGRPASWTPLAMNGRNVTQEFLEIGKIGNPPGGRPGAREGLLRASARRFRNQDLAQSQEEPPRLFLKGAGAPPLRGCERLPCQGYTFALSAHQRRGPPEVCMPSPWLRTGDGTLPPAALRTAARRAAACLEHRHGLAARRAGEPDVLHEHSGTRPGP